MKWNKIRDIYPNQWVKLLILNSHEAENKEYIDEMEVIKNFTSDDEATDELVNCTDKELVYHTSKEEIYSEIRNIFFSYRNRRM
ncbi:hypothetical protein [Clostridium sp.]|uniref:hypothetical protein n=1 Tax=Clostridium sp. TaxID=1506 RepID=UPI003D6D0EE6